MYFHLRRIYHSLSTCTSIKNLFVPNTWVRAIANKYFGTLSVHCNEYFDLLEASKSTKELKKIHAYMLINGLEQDIFLGTKLVHMYNVHGNLENAKLVFDRISERNVFIWNALIRGYVRNGLYEVAVGFYSQMIIDGIGPNKFTFLCVFTACTGLLDLQKALKTHGNVIRRGFEFDVCVACVLVVMYAKFGIVHDARQLFDEMTERDVAVWNAMMGAYVQNGFCAEGLNLFGEMVLGGERPDPITVTSIVPACAQMGALPEGKEIHGFVVRNGFESEVFVGSALLDMYAKCGSLDYAQLVFDRMTERNVVSWNSLILGYAQNRYCKKSVELCRQMQLAGVKPDSTSVACILSACASLVALRMGKEIHGYVIRSEFLSISAKNALIDMYAKCRHIKDAFQQFNKMLVRDIVSWCTMVAGCSQNGYCNEALKLFGEIQSEGIRPDADTVACVLSACAQIGALRQGKEIHGYVIRSGFESDAFVGSGLIDMYSKCGSVAMASQVFNKISNKNVVPWNAMIAGYAQNGYLDKSLKLFCQMPLTGMNPDSVTISSAISTCADLAALCLGKEIHNYVIRNGIECDVVVDNSLIDMYAKCGNIQAANTVFRKMPQRNVVSWNVMIAAYGKHGQAGDAIALFNKMQHLGMKPDAITFVALLSACSHAGLVNEAWQYFNSMCKDHHMVPRMEHYASMVDVLGRAGHLNEAFDFIKTMPTEADAGVWGALFGACRNHHNVELGEHVADCLFELKPKNAGIYALLSNIYAAAGRWDDKQQIRKMMKSQRLKKMPGCSWIEVRNQAHAFIRGE